MTERPILSRKLKALAEAAMPERRTDDEGRRVSRYDKEGVDRFQNALFPDVIFEVAALLEDAWRLLPSHPHVQHQAADWLDRYERLADLLPGH